MIREATFYILLIGADGYFLNQLSNGGTYRSLGGCVNDVERVEAMLRARLKGHQLVFTKLIAHAGAAGLPAGDPAAWPTAANIRRALRELAERAQPGDQVYIHYSGHGGRVVTAFKKLKGNDGVDVALVPIDIGRPDVAGSPPRTRPERYIRDVELAYYLDQLARKVDGDQRVTITLVFDSCYSGGATRGTGDRANDGVKMFDRREMPDRACSDELIASMAEAHARLLSSGARPNRPTDTTWLPEARGYVLLAACRDVESAIEASIAYRPRCGILTEALLEALDTLCGDQTWKTVYDRILAYTGRLQRSQTPQLLGDIDRHVFGVEIQPVPHTLTVTEVDLEARTVKVSGGLALCVTRGTELGIFAPGTTDFSLAETRFAIATVIESDALESTAMLDEIADIGCIEPGAPVAIHALSLKHQVELFVRYDLPTALMRRQDAVLDELRSTISREGNGFVEEAIGSATPQYQVGLSPQGHFEICDGQGQPLPYLEPLIKIDDPRAASAVVARLRRVGRYNTVLQMAEPELTQPESGERIKHYLTEQLQVDLLVAPSGWRDTEPPAFVGGCPPPYQDGAYTVPSDTWMWLRLTNKNPNQPLNVALIDLNRKWEIEMIVPNPNELRGKKYESITYQRTFAFKMYTPVPEAIDVLKLFISDSDVDFPAIATSVAQTEKLLTDAARSPLGSTTARVSRPVLGPLVDAVGREACPPTRLLPWTVIEIRMRTLQRVL